jgi:tripartite-type tricarboxylate transporter receptor subunit TctC
MQRVAEFGKLSSVRLRGFEVAGAGSHGLMLVGGMMMMRARDLLAVAAIAAAILTTLSAGSAQTPYPEQRVRMVLPFVPGGPNDQLARPLAQKLSENLSQTFYIENRGGANTLIGAGVVATAPPDGYTMLFSTSSHTANPSIVTKMPFDALRDFAPITQMVKTYGTLLMVRADFPARNVRELVEMAKRDPGKYTYGHGGIANATHVAVELFKSAAEVNILAVPFKGTGDAIPGLLGGQVDMIGISTVVGTPFIKSGQMRALGITGEVRAPLLPDVQTFSEQGYPDVLLSAYYGLWFPAGTPSDRIGVMHREVKKALQSPELTGVIADSSLQLVASSPEDFAEFLAKDLEHQARVHKRIGLAPR